MNPYSMLGSANGTSAASSLGARVAAWHDAMVAHERRLLAGRGEEACDEECAHAEARALWAEAVKGFGPRAHGLTFLRSRALGTVRGRDLQVGCPDSFGASDLSEEFIAPTNVMSEAAKAA